MALRKWGKAPLLRTGPAGLRILSEPCDVKRRPNVQAGLSLLRRPSRSSSSGVSRAALVAPRRSPGQKMPLMGRSPAFSHLTIRNCPRIEFQSSPAGVGDYHAALGTSTLRDAQRVRSGGVREQPSPDPRFPPAPSPRRVLTRRRLDRRLGSQRKCASTLQA